MPSTDQTYLLTQQYHNATNLNARIQLHQRFRTNPCSWYQWIFDQFVFPVPVRILELGCGSGALWQENCARIAAEQELLLSDFSAGKLADAQQTLHACPHPFAFQCIDAQQIPFADGQFDAIIANNMLYHVPERARALAEIQRVLRRGGRFYAATNGPSHMQEVRQLIERFDATADIGALEGFTLERGAAEVATWFDSVHLQRYENALIVSEAEPLVAYIMSGRRLRAEQHDLFRRFVEHEIATHGPITIMIDASMFAAQRAVQVFGIRKSFQAMWRSVGVLRAARGARKLVASLPLVSA